jgi:hypothetical protein
VVADGRPCKVLEVNVKLQPLQKATPQQKDWKSPVRDHFDRTFGQNWEFLCIEFTDPSRPDEFTVCLLKNGGGAPSAGAVNRIWMIPVNRRIVAGCTKRVVRCLI